MRPYRFSAVTGREMQQLRSEGLDPDRTWFDSLKDARAAHKNKRIIMVSAAAVNGRRIGLSDVLNGEPFRPPARIQAAGGILVRPGPEILLIFRRGSWDLPKGKRDPGETKRACAAREVREELGIPDVTVIRRLGRTVHAYPTRRRYMLKTTHWYLMRTESTTFTPQRAEGIRAVAWVPLDQAVERLDFHSLRDLVERHLDDIRAAAPA